MAIDGGGWKVSCRVAIGLIIVGIIMVANMLAKQADTPAQGSTGAGLPPVALSDTQSSNAGNPITQATVTVVSGASESTSHPPANAVPTATETPNARETPPIPGATNIPAP